MKISILAVMTAMLLTGCGIATMTTLSGCGSQQMMTKEVLIPHDATEAIIEIPEAPAKIPISPPFGLTSPCDCDTPAIQRAAHFDVSEDVGGEHFRVKKDSNQVLVQHKSPTDSVWVAYEQRVYNYPPLAERIKNMMTWVGAGLTVGVLVGIWLCLAVMQLLKKFATK